MSIVVSPCIVCGILHEHAWEGKPSMWCEVCSKLKTDLAANPQHIYRSLYLGNFDCARHWDLYEDGRIISVHENPEYAVGVHMPFMAKKPKSDWDRSGGLVDLVALDKVCALIDSNITKGEERPFLIHCKGGIERSPLAVAYYLHHKLGFTYHEAYNFIIRKRPIVSSRLEWLPEDYRKEHLTY